MVGDGSYLMMAQEIVTSVQEGCKLIMVLLDSQGYASIGGALALARLAGVRHAVSLPRCGDRRPLRCAVAGGPGRERRVARRPRASRLGPRQPGCGPGRRPRCRSHDGDLRPGRSAAGCAVATSRGGTCRSPRCRRRTPCARPDAGGTGSQTRALLPVGPSCRLAGVTRPERDHRIDLRRPPRRQVGGRRGHGEHQRDDTERSSAGRWASRRRAGCR